MSLELFLPKEQILNKSVQNTAGYFLHTATSYRGAAVRIPLLECCSACYQSICTLNGLRPNNVTNFLQDLLWPCGKCWFGTQIPRRTANFSCRLLNININISPLMQSAQRWYQNSTLTQQVLNFFKHQFHNFLSEVRMEFIIMKRRSFAPTPINSVIYYPTTFSSTISFNFLFFVKISKATRYTESQELQFKQRQRILKHGPLNNNLLGLSSRVSPGNIKE